MKTLMIDRNEWRRGNLAGKELTTLNSKLLCSKTNTKCCLGFLALDCGYSESEILDKNSPDSVGVITNPNCKITNLWPKRICTDSCSDDGYYSQYYWFNNTSFTSYLMTINDSIDFTEPEREKHLITLFLEMNIDLQFIN